MYIKLSQKVEVEHHLYLSTKQNISFQNQVFPILKICPSNITLLQKTKDARISKK